MSEQKLCKCCRINPATTHRMGSDYCEGCGNYSYLQDKAYDEALSEIDTLRKLLSEFSSEEFVILKAIPHSNSFIYECKLCRSQNVDSRKLKHVDNCLLIRTRFALLPESSNI